MTNLLQIYWAMSRAKIYEGNTAPANFAGILGTGVVAWPNYTVIGWF